MSEPGEAHALLLPEISEIMDKMKLLISRLPHDLPEEPIELSKYAEFIDFKLDEELLEKTGDKGSALSEHLKRVFGWASRSTGDGIIPITERGRPLIAIQDVLKTYLAQNPGNSVIVKWVGDIIIGLEKVYKDFGVDIPNPSDFATPRSKCSRADTAGSAGVPTKALKLSSSASVANAVRKTNAGRHKDPLLHRVAVQHKNDKGEKYWTCIAPGRPGCDYSRKGNVGVDRVYKHAKECPHLRNSPAYHDIWQEVIDRMADDSLQARISASESAAAGADLSVTTAETGNGIPGPSLSQSKLDISKIKGAGKKEKAAKNQLFQDRVDLLITQLICVRGMVPSIVDSPEWKALVTTLNGTYKPTSSTMFSNTHIPKLAAHISKEQLKILKSQQDLTLMFDGSDMRRGQSFYTTHITTPDRQTFFVEGHKGTGERHTKEWVLSKVMKTITWVGEENVLCLCSDSTSVTWATRADAVKRVPTMFDIWDCVHFLQNMIGNVCGLPAFKSAITLMKSTLKHFSKSGQSTALIRAAYKALNPEEDIKALQKVSKVRFGTLWTSAVALLPYLPHIRQLVQGKKIKFKASPSDLPIFKTVTELSFQSNTVQEVFLSQATSANASDVMIFWLAIAASIKELFNKSENETGIPRSVANEVIEIYNRQYNKFHRNPIYFTALMLDPRYKRHNILKPTLRLNQQASSSKPDIQYEDAFNIMKNFLKAALIEMCNAAEKDITKADPLFAKLALDLGLKLETDIEDIIAHVSFKFKDELESFWRGDSPFNLPVKSLDPQDWWTTIQDDSRTLILARLAIKIFSCLINSMPDERTNSAITWLNSPLRDWYMNHSPEAVQKDSKPKYRPAVKFCMLDKKTLRELKGLPADSEDDLLDDGNGHISESGSDDEFKEDGDETSEYEVSREVVEHLTTKQAVASSTTAPLLKIEIHSFIDITSPVLQDLVSLSPTIDVAATAMEPPV
ncbi:hypothetical protein EST38_g5489 [Candolleomyces aberdarensis]|uniref:Uncharacterized protein n=1 Tax=Candolleomyces aberdarensis TaxID=2316362 RepID=A0A4Q2DNK3_9AGAR|nr:hypothetical protein EST38_g5489 [Candolleomyces aberdarensis]